MSTSHAQQLAAELRTVLSTSPTLAGLCGFVDPNPVVNAAALLDRIWLVDAGDSPLDPELAPLILLTVTPGDAVAVDGVADLTRYTLEAEVDIYLPPPTAATPEGDFDAALAAQTVLRELRAADESGALSFFITGMSLSPPEREPAERDTGDELGMLLLLTCEAYDD